METTIKLPKQLKFDERGFHFINDAEKNKTALIVGHGQVSNDAAFMAEVIRRYNYFPLVYKALVLNTIVLALITILLLVF